MSHAKAIVAGQLCFSLILISGCVGGTSPLPDTPELRLEKAREVVAIEVDNGVLDATLDLGADLAYEAAAATLADQVGREITDDEAKQVRAVLRDALADTVTSETWGKAVASVYAKHFSPNEMQAAIDFFGSEAGRKILREQGAIHGEVGSALEAIVTNDLDAFVATVDARLAAKFPGLGTRP